MKLFTLLVVLGFLLTPALAVSDTGLLKADKTLAYFLMPINDLRHYSSGLAFNQKQDENNDLEIIYTSYQSVYLLTTNVTQVNAHLKRKLFELGPASVSGLVGAGLMYSPAVGGGLIGDVGGVAVMRPLPGLAISTPLYVSIFNDGIMINLYPGLAAKLPFGENYEIFGGLKIDARVVGNVQQVQSTGSGAVSFYYLAGFRAAM